MSTASDARKWKIVFFGTPEFSVPFFWSLMHDPHFEIVLVVAQQDKPAGRGKRLQKPPTVVAARELGIEVFQPETLKMSEAIERLRNVNADVFVVVAYGKLIPKSILDLPPHGCVNVHPSLLPLHRGPSPLQATILSGAPEGGVSIMLLDEGMDSGPILASERMPLDAEETQTSLREKVMHAGCPLLIETLVRYLSHEITPLPQNESRATISKLLTRQDGRINWNTPVNIIERMVRAYEGWPGTWTIWTRNNRPMRLKILSVTPTDLSADFPPGTVQVKNSELFVECADGTLKILTLQPEGRDKMNAAEFLKGYSDIAGATLG